MTTGLPTLLPTTASAPEGYYTPIPSFILVSIGIVIGFAAMLCSSKFSKIKLWILSHIGFNKERMTTYSDLYFMGPGSVRNPHGIPAEVAMTELFFSHVEENPEHNTFTICQGPCIDQYPKEVRKKVVRSQSERKLLSDKFYLFKPGRGGQEIEQNSLSKPQGRSGRPQNIVSDASRKSWSCTYSHQPEGGIPISPHWKVDSLQLAQNELSEIADDVSLQLPIKFQPEGSSKFLIENERELVNQTMDTLAIANEPPDSLFDLESSKASRRSPSKTGMSRFSVYPREGFRSFRKSSRLMNRNPSLLFLSGSSLLPFAEYQGVQGSNPPEFGLRESQTSEYSSYIPGFGESYVTFNSLQNLQNLEEKRNLDHPSSQSHELRLAGYDSYLTIESRSGINDAAHTALAPIDSVSLVNPDEARMSLTPETNTRSANTEDPSAVAILNVTLEKSSVIDITPSVGLKSNLVIQQNNHASIFPADSYVPKDLSNSKPFRYLD